MHTHTRTCTLKLHATYLTTVNLRVIVTSKHLIWMEKLISKFDRYNFMHVCTLWILNYLLFLVSCEDNETNAFRRVVWPTGLV